MPSMQAWSIHECVYFVVVQWTEFFDLSLSRVSTYTHHLSKAPCALA